MTAQTCNWCGKELLGKRRHAEYCDSSCRGNATLWRQSRSGENEKALGSASPPPIQAIREGQETAKAHWSMIVREGIIEVLKTTGAYHADDLDHLGIPDEHRNIIGSQTAKLVNQKWIEEVGRRKSILPTRNGAKSGIYKLTALGKSRIVGVGGGEVQPPVSASSRATPHSGESGFTGPGSGAGVANPQGPPGSPLSLDCASTASSDKPLIGVDGEEPRGSVETPVDSGGSVHSDESGAQQLFPESSYERLKDVA